MFNLLFDRINSGVKLTLGTATGLIGCKTLLAMSGISIVNYISGGVLLISSGYFILDFFEDFHKSKFINELKTDKKNLCKENNSLELFVNDIQLEKYNLSDINNNLELSNKKLIVRMNKLSELNKIMGENIKLLNFNMKRLEDSNEKKNLKINKLIIIEDNVKKLIEYLMSSGDEFKEFRTTLTQSLIKLEDTNECLVNLLENMENKHFVEIDLNHNENKSGCVENGTKDDEIINEYEFDSWMENS